MAKLTYAEIIILPCNIMLTRENHICLNLNLDVKNGLVNSVVELVHESITEGLNYKYRQDSG